MFGFGDETLQLLSETFSQCARECEASITVPVLESLESDSLPVLLGTNPDFRIKLSHLATLPSRGVAKFSPT